VNANRRARRRERITAERADTHLYGRADVLVAPKVVDYTIIPLTQAILEGYGANAVSPAQLASFPLATLSDFMSKHKL
jgi:hypothetical protein